MNFNTNDEHESKQASQCKSNIVFMLETLIWRPDSSDGNIGRLALDLIS